MQRLTDVIFVYCARRWDTDEAEVAALRALWASVRKFDGWYGSHPVYESITPEEEAAAIVSISAYKDDPRFAMLVGRNARDQKQRNYAVHTRIAERRVLDLTLKWIERHAEEHGYDFVPEGKGLRGEGSDDSWHTDYAIVHQVHDSELATHGHMHEL